MEKTVKIFGIKEIKVKKLKGIKGKIVGKAGKGEKLLKEAIGFKLFK